jgi:hypothetical protein
MFEVGGLEAIRAEPLLLELKDMTSYNREFARSTTSITLLVIHSKTGIGHWIHENTKYKNGSIPMSSGPDEEDRLYLFCSDSAEDPLVILTCEHIFCKACIGSHAIIQVGAVTM